MKSYRTWIEISERALSHNISSLSELLEKNARFCAVVKANAYGHGLLEVAQIAGRCDVNTFAVDQIDDALILRERFPSALILVLGYTMFDRFLEAIQNDIHITLYDKEGVEHAEKVARGLAKTFKIHLKIETGTSRQGVMLDDVADIARTIVRSNAVTVIGASTHFANIEDSGNPQFATLQFSRFQEAVEILSSHGINPELLHCACSAAIILYPETHLNMVRAGISMYGLWSSDLVQTTVRNLSGGCDLQPVLSWKTRIAQIKSLPMGTAVGYGLTEVLKRSGRIAVLPVGYYDGYDRSLSSCGEVLVKGYRCKVIGRVCMNMMMVDVSHVPNIQKEDEVILIGTDGRHRVTADELAQKAGTISYELISRINSQLPRVVI
ncbi:MAG: alanine racemase [Parcubacteria group bacterium]|nr:alanine racemase [Parcubacteria group bacterium]